MLVKEREVKFLIVVREKVVKYLNRKLIRKRLLVRNNRFKIKSNRNESNNRNRMRKKLKRFRRRNRKKLLSWI